MDAQKRNTNTTPLATLDAEQRHGAFGDMLDRAALLIVPLDNIGYALRTAPDLIKQIKLSEHTVRLCIELLAENLTDHLQSKAPQNGKSWDHIMSVQVNLAALKKFVIFLGDDRDYDDDVLSGIGAGIERLIHMAMENLNAAARAEGFSKVGFGIEPGGFLPPKQEAA